MPDFKPRLEGWFDPRTQTFNLIVPAIAGPATDALAGEVLLCPE
jgi:hypothetical protein